MRALILDGAGGGSEAARAAAGAITARLAARGYAVARHDLTALAIPDCNGDFGCWTVTPGVCVQPGPHREVARDLIQSDLAVYLSPVTFGGYSSALKRQLDHCVPLVSPWFTRLAGETHHVPRYERAPRLLAVGLLERPDAAAAAVFERLVERNALNLHAPSCASAVLTPAELPRLDALAATWLDAAMAHRPRGAGAPPLDLAPGGAGLPAVRPHRALVLVGSPRGAASVSAALARQLAAALQPCGTRVEVELVRACSRQERELDRVARAVEEADVVALAAPVYVDSLPGQVTELLEALARRRSSPAARRGRFLALVNCGFPEAVHCDAALAICRLFAAQAGLDWIGGLAFGGGGMLAGKPLAEAGGRARNAVRALALTADAVARGALVPDEAQRLARALAVPAWLYRIMADWTFRQEGKRRGTLRRMNAHPHAP